jgi:hypothetical protein
LFLVMVLLDAASCGESDPKRLKTGFKAMIIKFGGAGGHEFGLKIDETNLPARQEVLVEMSRRVAWVHGLAKRVPPETVEQAIRNEPFEDYARAIYGYRRACGEGGKARDGFNQSYTQAVKGFLRL